MSTRDASESPVALSFAKLLRTARHEAQMTQQDLAVACGLERAYVSRLERSSSDPRLSTVVRLAGGLGITLIEFLRAAG
jgi:transcriptional regulator with XRE-family HTH domain